MKSRDLLALTPQGHVPEDPQVPKFSPGCLSQVGGKDTGRERWGLCPDSVCPQPNELKFTGTSQPGAPGNLGRQGGVLVDG